MTRLDALLDEAGMRPGSVTCAAVLGVLVGIGTLIGGVLAVVVLVEPPAVGWVVLLAWSVVAVQVVASVLLTVGGMRLAMGIGRSALVTGAALELLVCGAYLLHALTLIAPDSDNAPEAVVISTAVPVAVATAAASSLLLTLRRTATGYLLLSRRTASGA